MEPEEIVKRYLELASITKESEEMNLNDEQKQKLDKILQMTDILAKRIIEIKLHKEDNQDPVVQRIKTLCCRCYGQRNIDQTLLNELSLVIKVPVYDYLLFFQEKWVEYGVCTQIAFVDDITDRVRYEQYIKTFDPKNGKIPTQEEMLKKFMTDWEGIYYAGESPWICDYRIYKRISWVTQSSIYSSPMMTVNSDEIKIKTGRKRKWPHFIRSKHSQRKR